MDVSKKPGCAAGDVVQQLVEGYNLPAILAATLAIGKPVAVEASAEERETRGFISITNQATVFRFDRELHESPPVSTLRFHAAPHRGLRMIWYSLSAVRVCAVADGDGVPPVSIPMASEVFDEQTRCIIIFLSRTALPSTYSSQPDHRFIISIRWVGERSRAASQDFSNSRVIAIPPPCRQVKDGRIMHGNQRRRQPPAPLPSCGRYHSARCSRPSFFIAISNRTTVFGFINQSQSRCTNHGHAEFHQDPLTLQLERASFSAVCRPWRQHRIPALFSMILRTIPMIGSM